MKYVAKPLSRTADISRGRFNVKDTLRGVLALALTLIALYLVVVFAAGWVANNISDDTEREWLAAPYTAAYATTSPQQATALARADAILKTLLANDDTLRDLNYQLVLFESSEPNAFAFPGGGIGVSRGLLDGIVTDEGMAFVLAHELEHHQQRHLLKHFFHRIAWAIALNIAGLTNNGLNGVLAFSEAGYSRELEKEADLKALRRVYAVYGDKNFLEFFNNAPNDNNAYWQTLLGTHPLIKERLQYLNEERQRLRRGE